MVSRQRIKYNQDRIIELEGKIWGYNNLITHLKEVTIQDKNKIKRYIEENEELEKDE